MTAPSTTPNRGLLALGWERLLAATAILALIGILVVRLSGPSDAWDQTQPKTMSYTTDIVVNGNWALPVERGELKATKPPLYNWIAAPAVGWLGPDHDAAHRVPSMLALVLSFLLIMWIGRRADPNRNGAMGWIAAAAFVANYTMIKLGTLARPDMLLTLWLLTGWAAATLVFIDRWRHTETQAGGHRLLLVAVFWVSFALAGLTKGPAALALLVYAVFAARYIAGRWRAVLWLQWWWGLPMGLALVGLWVYFAWRADARHVTNVLWGVEIWGRITGTGPEGGGGGFGAWLRTLPHMPMYFVVRFLPWSIPALLAVLVIWRRTEPAGPRRWRSLGGEAGPWLQGSTIMILVTVVLYTLSTGKRADYIAAAFGPGSILAAWWILHAWPVGRRAPWLVPVGAAGVIISAAVVNQRQPAAPAPGFSEDLSRFMVDVQDTLRRDPRPLVTWNAGSTHLAPFLGHTDRDVYRSRKTWGRTVDEPIWVLGGRRTSDPATLVAWVEKQRLPLRVEPVLETMDAGPPARHVGWPEQVVLYRVDPVDPAEAP